MGPARGDEASVDLAARSWELLARGRTRSGICDEMTRAQFIQGRCHSFRWNGSVARELVRVVLGMAFGLDEQPGRERAQSFAGAFDYSHNVLALHIPVGERRQRGVDLRGNSVLIGWPPTRLPRLLPCLARRGGHGRAQG